MQESDSLRILLQSSFFLLKSFSAQIHKEKESPCGHYENRNTCDQYTHSIPSRGIQTEKQNSGHSRMCFEDCTSTIRSREHRSIEGVPGDLNTEKALKAKRVCMITRNSSNLHRAEKYRSRVFIFIATAIKMNTLSSRSSINMTKKC